MKSGVFIIESLYLEEEKEELHEGVILSKMLKLLGVNVFYVYIRTKKELKHMILQFEESDYKYLHLALHGDEKGFGLTFHETVTFEELDKMFEFEKRSSRLFLSSCSIMNSNIEKHLQDTRFVSIVGPLEDVCFSDITIFWSSFYHLMFSKNKRTMKSNELKNVIQDLVNIYNISMSAAITVGPKYIKYDLNPAQSLEGV